ncbi:hypothetical protein [Actinomadura madurae]|nr:hypothetical protein [Actinomadura madurae]MCP9970666.1 hypothetical protein [Actinomadura madurae]MCQ0005304.1 hypothetical protein [Actinomadura madurae]
MVTRSAAARPAPRPVTVAPSSSRRPASSSARVCRTTVSALISPMITGMNPHRWAMIPPRSGLYSGPYSARNVGFVPEVCAYWRRSAAVG